MFAARRRWSPALLTGLAPLLQTRRVRPRPRDSRRARARARTSARACAPRCSSSRDALGRAAGRRRPVRPQPRATCEATAPRLRRRAACCWSTTNMRGVKLDSDARAWRCSRRLLEARARPCPASSSATRAAHHAVLEHLDRSSLLVAGIDIGGQARPVQRSTRCRRTYFARMGTRIIAGARHRAGGAPERAARRWS